MAKQYFNWKLAFVLIVALAVFAAAAIALHRWQRSTRAEEALPLGEQAYEQGDWEVAAMQLGRYVAVHGDDIEVLLKYADAQLKIRPLTSGNVGFARAAYSSVLRQDSGNTKAARQLVELHLASPGEAELKARRFLEGNEDAVVRRLLGIALVQQRKFQEAGQIFVDLIRDHPDEILAYETMGQLAVMRPGDVNEPAEHWFDEAVKQNPDAVLAYAVRSAFRRRQGDREGALADLEKAAALDLSDTDVHLRLVGELVNLQEMDKAREHLESLRATAPEEQGLWLGWAEVALRAGSVEEMQMVAETGLEALAGQPWDFMPVAAELFVRAARWEQAKDSIIRMKEKNVQPARVAFLEGFLAGEQGRHREAIEFWERAIGLGYQSPQDRRWRERLPLVRMALASAFVKSGDTQSALGHVRILVSQMPRYPGGHLLLARLEAGTGNWAAVLEHVSQVQQLAPGNDEVTLLELQARVRQLAGSGDGAGNQDETWRVIEDRLAELGDSAEAAMVLQVRLLQAESALFQDHHERALAVLDDVERNHPSEARAVLLRARAYTNMGKEQEAIAALRQAGEQFPQNADVVTQLALLYNRQEKQSECEALIKEAMGRIEQVQARRNLGLLLAQLYRSWKQDDRLHEWLTQVAEQCPDDIQTKRRFLALPRVIEDVERAQKIVDEIRSLEGEKGWQWRTEQARLWIRLDNFDTHYTEAVRLLQENLLTSPDDQTSRVLLGAAYEKAGETQLAATTYKEALERARTPDDRQIRLILAGAYEKAGSLRLALDVYREALEREPGNMLVVGRTVQALHRAEEFEEARRILENAAALDLEHDDLQRLRLQGDLQQGELGSASDILQEILKQDPNDLSSQFTLALIRIRQEKFDEAQGILTGLRAEYPDSVLVTQAQARLYITQGQGDQALRLCDALVDLLPENVPAHTLRARIRAELGFPDKALADLDKIVTLAPETPAVWLMRANFYRDLGRPEDEMADVKKVLSLAPNNLEVQQRALTLALATDDRALFQEAESLLDKAIREHPKDVDLKILMVELLLRKGTKPAAQRARVLLGEVTRDQPNRTEAWGLLGRFELREGQPGGAVDVALRGLTYNPNDRGLLLLKADAEAQRSPMLAVPTLKELLRQDPNDLDALVRLADAAVNSGMSEKVQEQVELLQERLLVLEGPPRRRCEMILAATLARSGQIDKARIRFKGLRKADPNDPTPILALAQVPGSLGSYPELRQFVNEWTTRHPDDVEVPVRVAVALFSGGNKEEIQFCDDLLRSTLQRHPESVRVLRVLADLALQTGRDEESGTLNRRILDVNAGDLIALNNLSWFLCENKGRYPEALELANRGLQVEALYLDLIDTRGVIYYRMGRYEEAIRDFRQFVDLCPTQRVSLPTTRFHLARAYAEMGRKAEAIQQLELTLNEKNAADVLSASDLTEAKLLLDQLKKGS